MSRYISIGETAKLLGVSVQTLRRWDKAGILLAERAPSGHRRYLRSEVATFNPLGIHTEALSRPTVAYARVSSHDQRKDLDRQIKVLEMYCASHGWQYEIVSDLGSGMNYKKKGLVELLDQIVKDKVGRLVLTHKDRLLRFGAELVFAICETKHVEIVIINQGDERSFEEELASDVLEIVTVFSARMYGSRSHKNKKLIDGVTKAVNDVKDT